MVIGFWCLCLVMKRIIPTWNGQTAVIAKSFIINYFEFRVFIAPVMNYKTAFFTFNDCLADKNTFVAAVTYFSVQWFGHDYYTGSIGPPLSAFA